jgi:hypothetical protein
MNMYIKPKTNATLRDMDAAYTEAMMQEAIAECKVGRYKSVRTCAIVKGVPRTTLQYRISGHNRRSHGHENAQILTNPEDSLTSVDRADKYLLSHIARIGC